MKNKNSNCYWLNFWRHWIYCIIAWTILILIEAQTASDVYQNWKFKWLFIAFLTTLDVFHDCINNINSNRSISSLWQRWKVIIELVVFCISDHFGGTAWFNRKYKLSLILYLSEFYSDEIIVRSMGCKCTLSSGMFHAWYVWTNLEKMYKDKLNQSLPLVPALKYVCCQCISIGSDGIKIWTITQNVTTNLTATQGQRMFLVFPLTSRSSEMSHGSLWQFWTMNHEHYFFHGQPLTLTFKLMVSFWQDFWAKSYVIFFWLLLWLEFEYFFLKGYVEPWE